MEAGIEMKDQILAGPPMVCPASCKDAHYNCKEDETLDRINLGFECLLFNMNYDKVHMWHTTLSSTKISSKRILKRFSHLEQFFRTRNIYEAIGFVLLRKESRQVTRR